MKILKFFFAFALLASFASCSPDDIPTQEEVIGTWEITEVNLQGTATTTDSQGEVTVADLTGTGFDLDLQITIEENPNTFSVDGDFSVMVEYSIDGTDFELPLEDVEFIEAGTWDITDDIITVVGSNDIETASISNIDETSLVLDWVYTQTDTQFGNSIVQNITGTYTFEKL